MKKLFLVLLTAAAIGLVPAMADSDTYFNKGAVVAQAGVGFGLGIGVEGGADMSLGQWTPIEVLPLDYGVGARAGFSTGSGYSSFGLGAYGVINWSAKALKSGISFVDALEFTNGYGIGFYMVSVLGASASAIGLDGYSGLTYHVDDKLGIQLGYYLGTGSTIGVTYKL